MTRRVSIAAYLLLLMVSLMGGLMGVSDDQQIVSQLVVAALACVIFLFSRRANGIKYFQPVYLFLLAYVIVFFQRPLDYALGYIQGTNFFLANVSQMPYSMMLSNMGLISFLIGYSTKVEKLSKTKDNVSRKYAKPVVFSFLTSLVLFLIIVMVPRTILYGGYGQSLLSNASTYNYLSSWAKLFIVAFLIQSILYYRNSNALYHCGFGQFLRAMGTWQNFNIALYALIILNVGDRGPLIIIATAYYLAYIIISKRNVNKWLLVALLLFGILATSFLGRTKEFRDNNTIFDRIELSKGGNAQPKTSMLPLTEELANSYVCLPTATSRVPELDNYSYGMLQLSYLLSSIPFSVTFVNYFIDLPQSSSYIISHYIQGDFLDYGNGTSCIADLYLDGGLFFVLIGMLCWGIFLKFAERQILFNSSVSLFTLCVVFFFLIHAIYIPRSVILSPFKYAIWLYAIVWLYNARTQKSNKI